MFSIRYIYVRQWLIITGHCREVIWRLGCGLVAVTVLEAVLVAVVERLK